MKSKSISVADLVELARISRDANSTELQSVEDAKSTAARAFFCSLVGRIAARVGDEEADALAAALGFDHLVP